MDGEPDRPAKLAGTQQRKTSVSPRKKVRQQREAKAARGGLAQGEQVVAGEDHRACASELAQPVRGIGGAVLVAMAQEAPLRLRHPVPARRGVQAVSQLRQRPSCDALIGRTSEPQRDVRFPSREVGLARFPDQLDVYGRRLRERVRKPRHEEAAREYRWRRDPYRPTRHIAASRGMCQRERFLLEPPRMWKQGLAFACQPPGLRQSIEQMQAELQFERGNATGHRGVLDGERAGRSAQAPEASDFQEVANVVPVRLGHGAVAGSAFLHGCGAQTGNCRPCSHTYAAGSRLAPLRRLAPMPTLQHRIAVARHGGPEQMRLVASPLPPPGSGEVRIRQRAIGVNYVDVYFRTGVYPLASFPSGLGVEAAGVVEAVGGGVDPAWAGRRVAYAGPPVGAYADVRNIAVSQLAQLPDDIDDATAAAVLLRGLTAHMLFAYVRPLRAGDTVLVHAAAGGLGLILSQWAAALGARVIGTVGTDEKAELARRHGVERAVVHTREDFVEATREFTHGRGADFVIDGIGGDTFNRSLDALGPFGMAASIGQVAGDVASIDLARLHASRSISVSRPGVFRFMADGARYREGCDAVFRRLAAGLCVRVGGRLPLERAQQAHELLESGRSTGSLLLIA